MKTEIQVQGKGILRKVSPTGELVNSFLSGRNEKTVKAYGRDLEDFREFVEAKDINAAAELLLSRGHGEANALVLKYKADMIERKLQPATVNRRLAAIRSLVKLARTLGMVPWILEIQNMKAESFRDTRGPGRESFSQMLAIAGGQAKGKALRDVALLRLLHDLGLRRAEVAGLDIEDLDIKAGTVAVLGKGRTQKQIMTLPEPTKQALREWLTYRNASAGPLFVNFDRAKKGGRLTGTGIYYIIRDIGKIAGIKTWPHGLRHLAITEACKAAQSNGFGLEEVLDFSRHKDVKTLMIYRDRERNVQGQLAALVAAAGC